MFAVLSRCVATMKAIRLWHAFIALRIILTLRLQPGYIHPDEFFQSVEVLAGEFGLFLRSLIFVNYVLSYAIK